MVLLIGQAILHAQQWPERLKHYSIGDGLTANNVVAIEEDDLGFIWVGTEEGLNRFDGTNFKHFFASNQPGGLAANYVMDILHIGQGRMLVALAGDGLQIYDPETEQFTSIDHPQVAGQMPYKAARSLILESDSTFLAAYWKGPKSSGGLVRFSLRDFSSEVLFPNRITQLWTISPGVDHEIWLSGDSLFCLNYDKLGSLTRFESPFRRTKNVPYYAGILALENEVLVSSRGEGVHVFNRSTGQFESKHTYQEEGVSMIYNQVMGLLPFEGRSNSYWCITRDKGIGIWERQSETFHFINTSEKWSTTRGETMAQCEFIDHRGNVWFGSNSGLFMHSVDNYQIGYVDLRQELGLDKEYSAIFCVEPIGEELFVGTTRANGALRLNMQSLAFEQLAPEKGITIDGEEFRVDVSSLRLSASGKLLATGYNRLYEFDAERNNWKIIFDLTKEIDPISKYSGLVSFEESSDQRYWWFGTIDNWFARYDRQTRTLKSWWLVDEGEMRKKVVSPDGKLGFANRIYSIAPDTKNGAYVASYSGVFYVTDNGIEPMKDDCGDCAFFERNAYGRIRRHGDRLIFGTAAEGVYSYGLADHIVRH